MVFSRVRLHAESQKTGNCFFMRQYRKWSMHDPACWGRNTGWMPVLLFSRSGKKSEKDTRCCQQPCFEEPEGPGTNSGAEESFGEVGGHLLVNAGKDVG
jgi:hypothetical protein